MEVEVEVLEENSVVLSTPCKAMEGLGKRGNWVCGWKIRLSFLI